MSMFSFSWFKWIWFYATEFCQPCRESQQLLFINSERFKTEKCTLKRLALDEEKRNVSLPKWSSISSNIDNVQKLIVAVWISWICPWFDNRFRSRHKSSEVVRGDQISLAAAHPLERSLEHLQDPSSLVHFFWNCPHATSCSFRPFPADGSFITATVLSYFCLFCFFPAPHYYFFFHFFFIVFLIFFLTFFSSSI